MNAKALILNDDGQRSRKDRGAFFTPLAISRFLANWAIHTISDRVLEPSCGEASFLVAAAERMASFPQLQLFSQPRLQGVEIHHPSAVEAEKRVAAAGGVAEVAHADFFEVPASPDFDVVLGNPPFVRYQQFAGAGRERALRAALAAGVNLSGLASSWAAFLVHATRFLIPEGRLGFVLPAEVLTVGYAAPIRRFLLQRFASVRLVLFEELVFPDALEDVVLLMAEGSGGCDHFKVHQVRKPVGLEPDKLQAWVTVNPTEGTKWTQALVQPGTWEAYQRFVAGPNIDLLGDWGRCYLGAVTGDNDYFALSAEDVRKRGLSEKDLIRISPPGSRHLRGLEFSERAWRSLANEGRRCWLFRPRQGKLTSASERYIACGKDKKVHKAYKCQVRDPWYATPLVDTPDLLLTYMDFERPRLTTNSAGLLHLNSLYGVKLKHGRVTVGRDLLPLAALNTVTMLGAEVVGRSYGGGMLKLEPTEAERLPLPSHTAIARVAEKLRAIRPQLSVDLRQGRLAHAVETVDRIIYVETGALGAAELGQLRDAREFLFNRRRTRGKSSVEVEAE